MVKLDKNILTISIVYIVLTILNYINLVTINEYGIFGLTLGGLLICMSSCFNSDIYIFFKKRKIYIFKIIKFIYYISGWILMIIGVYLKSNKFFDLLVIKLDSNTLLLASLVFTFLSVLISDFNQKKQIQENEEIKKVIEELNKCIELNKKEIEKLRGNRRSIDE